MVSRLLAEMAVRGEVMRAGRHYAVSRRDPAKASWPLNRKCEMTMSLRA